MINNVKQSKTTASMLIVLLVLCTIFFLFSSKEWGRSSEVQGQQSEQDLISYQEVKQKNEQNGILIERTIPLFKGSEKQQDIVYKINGDLKKITDQKLADFTEQVSKEQKNSDAKNTFTQAFELVRLDKYLLSLAIYTDSFISGDAHPNRSINSYTYDFKLNKEIKIEDLFNTPERLTQLSHLSGQELRRYFLSLAYYKNGITSVEPQIDEGTKPDYKNFQYFLVRENGIEILFNENQVASYSDRRPRITLTFLTLTGTFNPNFKHYDKDNLF